MLLVYSILLNLFSLSLLAYLAVDGRRLSGSEYAPALC